MRPLALLLTLAATPALAGEGVLTTCTLATGRHAEVTCQPVAGDAFTVVPPGMRLEITDVILSNHDGRLAAQVGETVLWSLGLDPVVQGYGANKTFGTPLPVPAGGRLVLPRYKGEGLFLGRLVPVG